MRDFSILYEAIDSSTQTTAKVAAMNAYFAAVDDADGAWAVWFLIGRRPKRLIKMGDLRAWAMAQAGLAPWLFQECYDAVGDTAETISLILPASPSSVMALSLAEVVERDILPLAGATPEKQGEILLSATQGMTQPERFLFFKLITGALRVGVSQELVQRALSKAFGIPTNQIAHRLMGDWEPTPAFFRALKQTAQLETPISTPYPFCLAHAVNQPVTELGDVREWRAEWKWDGMRAQIVRRSGQTFVWSRGEELITDRFPEVSEIGSNLPDGTVLDGEIVVWNGSKPAPFSSLQKRMGRLNLTPKMLRDLPVTFIAYDILEYEGIDIRATPFIERRHILETFNGKVPLSELMTPVSWEELSQLREESRTRGTEGMMLKRGGGEYGTGRKKGLWFKWKIEPFTLDAVLIYAQRGSGKRASLYSDYTFALLNGAGEYVPVAKAYSGLTDSEIGEVDQWVRKNTLEKFGPVRSVTPTLVMEIAFEGIQASKRHKSGLAVRFPRISRWRKDKRADEVDRLEDVQKLVDSLEDSA